MASTGYFSKNGLDLSKEFVEGHSTIVTGFNTPSGVDVGFKFEKKDPEAWDRWITVDTNYYTSEGKDLGDIFLTTKPPYPGFVRAMIQFGEHFETIYAYAGFHSKCYTNMRNNGTRVQSWCEPKIVTHLFVSYSSKFSEDNYISVSTGKRFYWYGKMYSPGRCSEKDAYALSGNMAWFSEQSQPVPIWIEV